MPSWILVAAIAGGAPACASAPAIPSASRSPAAVGEISPAELGARIAERRLRVPEFAWIAEWARRRGVRAWIAGGTATGIAAYARTELANGLAESPTYAYGRIYRATQDVDVVLDADERVARELEDALVARFRYLQGAKSVWEVRLLRASRGEGVGLKEPLIDNRNFREQHTDSYSVGMVELTDPPPGQSVVRDLFAWDEPRTPAFLRDLASGTIRYYFSPTHGRTARAAAGINPPILSALRYYGKAFQYGAAPSPEDEATLRRVIAEFDPADPRYRSPYVRKQIESNARKLYLHARDLEFAHRAIEANGLLAKILAFTANRSESQETHRLLSRIPLASKPLGLGVGATAAELFGVEPLVVTHATREYAALESLSRASDGGPNAFQSIAGQPDQLARYGDGFYVRIGREGSSSGVLPIRFRLDPAAREGTDFLYVRDQGFLVIRNRRALRLIDESIHLTPIEYFRFVGSPEMRTIDAGIRRRLSLEVRSDAAALGERGLAEIEEFIEARIRERGDVAWLLEALFDFGLFPERRESWMKRVFDADLVNADRLFQLLSKRESYAPELVEFIVRHGKPEHLTGIYYFVLDRWAPARQYPEWMRLFAERNTTMTDNMVNGLLRTTEWGRQPDLVRACGGSPDAASLRSFSRRGGRFAEPAGRCPDLLGPDPDPFPGR